MSILDREELEASLKSAIIDRFEAWELVDFLNISTEEVVDIFEEELLQHIEEVTSLLNYGETDIDGED